MSDFFRDMQNTANHGDDNKILTANGAIAYASVGDSLVDFSYAANNLRNKSPEEIMSLFHRCYIDNPLMATKLMFQMGDVREGKGERRTFRACLEYMATAHPEVCKAILPLVPEYTRWDHVSYLMTHGDPTVQKFARKFMAEQLIDDFSAMTHGDANDALKERLTARLNETTDEKTRKQIQQSIDSIPPRRSLSLCAKWAPKLGAKKDGRHKEALKLVQTMGCSKADYRTIRSGLISRLNVVEQALSAGRIEDIDLEHMSSAQHAHYAKVMREKNADAYEEYLNKVESGEAKMNAQVLTPADVVHKYTVDAEYGLPEPAPFNRTLENLWNNLKQVDASDSKGCIVVRDDSGSMTNTVSRNTSMTALEVATALSLYCAERLQGPFRDKFISFSHDPKFLDVSPFDSLHDRLEYAYEHSEIANTNVKAVFDLMLNTAARNHTPPEEMPGTILIISDMEFDEGTTYTDNALFDDIRAQWQAAGYEMPALAFWNLNAERSVVPDVNDRGVVLLSGFTTDNLDMVLNGDLAQFTPTWYVQTVLSQARYDAVETAFRDGLKAERNSHTQPRPIWDWLPDVGYSKVTDNSLAREQDDDDERDDKENDDEYDEEYYDEEYDNDRRDDEQYEYDEYYNKYDDEYDDLDC